MYELFTKQGNVLKSLFDNTDSSGVHISVEVCTKIRDEIVTFFDSDKVISVELKTPRKRTNSALSSTQHEYYHNKAVQILNYYTGGDTIRVCLFCLSTEFGVDESALFVRLRGVFNSTLITLSECVDAYELFTKQGNVLKSLFDHTDYSGVHISVEGCTTYCCKTMQSLVIFVFTQM
jgi:predicted membrane channel-forming protein YqfA (hemolysin III family)